MSTEKQSDDLLTTERLIALAQVAGIDLGPSPHRRISYYVTLGLLERPRRHSEGRGTGVKAVFPKSALGRLREIQALADQDVPFNKMHSKLTSRRRATTEKEAADLNRTWTQIVATTFEDATKGEVKDVTKILSGLLERAKEFDEAIGAVDDLDEAVAHLYRVSRMAWVFASLHPEEEHDQAHRFFKREMQKAFTKVMVVCGFQLGKIEGPALRR